MRLKGNTRRCVNNQADLISFHPQGATRQLMKEVLKEFTHKSGLDYASLLEKKRNHYFASYASSAFSSTQQYFSHSSSVLGISSQSLHSPDAVKYFS